MPTDSAAMRLSRTDMMARPVRLFTRLSTTVTVTITSTMPMANVDIFVMPAAPCGPLMRSDPPCMPSDLASVSEKCRPLASRPT